MILVTGFFVYLVAWLIWRYGVLRNSALQDAKDWSDETLGRSLARYYTSTSWAAAVAALMLYSIAVGKWWVLPSILVVDLLMAVTFHYGKKHQEKH